MDYLVFRTSDGTLVKGGSASDQAHVLLQAGDGEIAFTVPTGVLAWGSGLPDGLDISPLKAQLPAAVDAAAGAFRAQFITVIAGQSETYQYKAAEAHAWTADNTISTPFLTPEATARGMTIAALAAEVIANETSWKALGGKIEGARMGAKTKIAAATSAWEALSATMIDWSALAA